MVHRFTFVEKMLDTVLARHDTVFMTDAQIADWSIEADRANWEGPTRARWRGALRRRCRP